MGLKILVSLVRFPVAPQNERELQQCNSFFITLCICCKTVGRNSTPDYAAGQTIRPASVSRPSAPVPGKNTKGRPESD